MFWKVDFLGVFDVVTRNARRPGLLGIQTTTESHRAAHLETMRASKELRERWLADGNRAEMWIYPNPAGRPPHPTPIRIPIA